MNETKKIQPRLQDLLLRQDVIIPKPTDVCLLAHSLAGTSQFKVWREEIGDPRKRFTQVSIVNSQVLPEDITKKLIDEVTPILTEEFIQSVSAEEFVRGGLQESDHHVIHLLMEGEKLISVSGHIATVFPFNGRDIRFLYRNASATCPGHKGYSSLFRNTMRGFPLDMWATSTNEPSLPPFWRKESLLGFGNGPEPWVFLPTLDIKPSEFVTIEQLWRGWNETEKKTLFSSTYAFDFKHVPKNIINALQKIRNISGLNVMSGTSPDWTDQLIRWSQNDGIKREPTEGSDDLLHTILQARNGFNAERGDQYLFVAVSPKLLQI